jgi:hypothetical protein
MDVEMGDIIRIDGYSGDDLVVPAWVKVLSRAEEYWDTEVLAPGIWRGPEMLTFASQTETILIHTTQDALVNFGKEEPEELLVDRARWALTMGDQ